MSDMFEAWFFGGDTYDRRTRDQLADVAAAESRARNRLAQQLRKQSGDLQSQIDRLTKAFVAFVEYEDVRGELNQYADAAAVRRYAREVVASLVMTGGANLGGLPVPADVHGYWLAAAAPGVALTAQGSTAEGDALLAEAAARDPRRTATFLVLLDALSRQARWTDRHLDAVLPASPEVTVAERAVWVAIASGRLGDDARKGLERALSDAVGSVDPAVIDDWLAERTAEPRRDRVPAEIPAGRLATLRAVVAGGPTLAAEPPPMGSHVDGPKDAPRPASEDPLADCVMSLVDQGAPGEDEILTRMEAARAEMGFVEPQDKGEEWDATAGRVRDLLLGDLADEDAPLRQELSRRVLAPALTSCAERLEQAARQPVPAQQEVPSIGGTTIMVAADGASDHGWRSAVEDAARRSVPLEGWWRPTTYGAAAVAAVGLVLMLVSPGFVVLAIAAAALAGYCVTTEWRSRSERTAAVASATGRAEREILAATERIAADRATASSAATAAGGHRAAITAALR